MQALNASMQRQDGITINPNNSFLQTLPAISIAGVFVRRDGDVIRIELPDRHLFEPGSNRLAARFGQSDYRRGRRNRPDAIPIR